jgi:hypothetical protein
MIQQTASIAGSWQQTGLVQYIRHQGSSNIDTIERHPQGYGLSLTTDSLYHFSGPYHHKADGYYSVNADTLSEYEPKSRSTEQFIIVSLSEHQLQLRTLGGPVQAGIAIETITTYERK